MTEQPSSGTPHPTHQGPQIPGDRMTFEGLPLALANGIGVVGVVLLVGWLVWTGRLVPKASHEREIGLLNNQLDDERHEKGEWRTESRLKDQQITELNEQNQAMLNAFGPTLTDFLRGLRRAGVGVAPDEGADQ